MVKVGSLPYQLPLGFGAIPVKRKDLQRRMSIKVARNKRVFSLKFSHISLPSS
ncbi:hypothetical protein SLEP1_g9711 [Rubroshorea leprosula]|uniref:Uncharacterized protein n=1 Tax=Rubroshorea leprosula TaxID=152421 RepID=A0AAV5IF60_9ROSI|nr:hypothetical protein SLEP1_g9711 [Rubroshorea leprosula]